MLLRIEAGFGRNRCHGLEEIMGGLQSEWLESRMTSDQHKSGTDRVNEVANESRGEEDQRGRLLSTSKAMSRLPAPSTLMRCLGDAEFRRAGLPLCP